MQNTNKFHLSELSFLLPNKLSLMFYVFQLIGFGGGALYCYIVDGNMNNYSTVILSGWFFNFFIMLGFVILFFRFALIGIQLTYFFYKKKKQK